MSEPRIPTPRETVLAAALTDAELLDKARAYKAWETALMLRDCNIRELFECAMDGMPNISSMSADDMARDLDTDDWYVLEEDNDNDEPATAEQILQYLIDYKID